MRKYLLGFVALLLAISFSAFTMLKRSTTTFKYQLSTYNEAQVESVAASSWLQGSVSCDNIDYRACLIEVDNIYTHLDGQGRRVLNNASALKHITIVAATVSGTDWYVDIATSINITSVQNKG